MYAADKSLNQESVAETISLFIHEISTKAQKAVFFQAALDTLAREWKGIDKFRMDKFYMLFTRVLRQALVHLKLQNWDHNEMSEFIKIIENSIICPSDNINSKPLGVKMHVADVLLEELAKVGGISLDHSVIIAFCYPFYKCFESRMTEANDDYEKFKINKKIRFQIEKMSGAKEGSKARSLKRLKKKQEQKWLKNEPKIPISNMMSSDVELYIAVDRIADQVGLPKQMVEPPEEYQAQLITKKDKKN